MIITIPNKIRCGSAIIDVCQHINLTEVFDLNGFYWKQEETLLIAADASYKIQCDAFMHEYTHAVLHEYGYAIHDEADVVRMTNGFLQLFRLELDITFDFSQLPYVQSVKQPEAEELKLGDDVEDIEHRLQHYVFPVRKIEKEVA